MIKDDPRGVGYLLGEPGPVDPVVQEYRNKIKELQRKPIDNPEDIFSQLPFVDKVNLGVSTLGANTKVTPPEARDKFGNTKAQKDKMIMAQITRKRKPYDWSVITKPAAKIMNEDADVTSPADAKQKKLPYWINYNGELLDANSAEQWQSVTKRAEEEKSNKISVSDNKVKGTYSPRNEVANRKPKILSTPMGQVKVIRNTNNEPGKMNKEITNKEGYVR